jgi:hypothetical protein
MGDITKPNDVSMSVGDYNVELKFDSQFSSKWNGNFNKAQAYVDSEVLRYCDPLVPKQTGNLIKSGTLGTHIGSGEVRYIAPYAHNQYWNTAETRPYDPKRGAHWFERMKTAHLNDIKRGVKQFIN